MTTTSHLAVTATPASQRTDYASILRTYSTDEAAAVLKIRPQKARNRFLVWDASAVDALLNGEASK